MPSRCFFVTSPALTAVTVTQRHHCQRHLQSSLLASQHISPLLLMKTCFDFSHYNCKKIHTLNPEITLLIQFHVQKALFKVPKI